MFTERTSVGLDVHARSVAAAAIDGVTGELVERKLTPQHEHIRSWLSELPAPVAVAYEAGPTGFGLSRSLQAAGIRCEVIAPSKLVKPPGDRVKTDAKDALHLARLLRLDEITPVAIPTPDQEAARDLVRAREDCRGDLMRARHRLSKLLLRHGIVYNGGRAWTGPHEQWLVRQRLDSPAAQRAFEEGLRHGAGHPGTAGPPRHRDHDDGRRQRVHSDRAPVGVPARHRHPDRIRACGGGRRLAPPTARARGDAGNRRLHARWVRFCERNKNATVANTAIARELAGWCWSLAVMDD